MEDQRLRRQMDNEKEINLKKINNKTFLLKKGIILQNITNYNHKIY